MQRAHMVGLLALVAIVALSWPDQRRYMAAHAPPIKPEHAPDAPAVSGYVAEFRSANAVLSDAPDRARELHPSLYEVAAP